MNKSNTMTTKQVHTATEKLFEALAERLQHWSHGCVTSINGKFVAEIIEATLADQFGLNGGVLLIWWDQQYGLRCNPAAYDPPPRRKRGRMVRRDSRSE